VFPDYKYTIGNPYQRHRTSTLPAFLIMLIAGSTNTGKGPFIKQLAMGFGSIQCSDVSDRSKKRLEMQDFEICPNVKMVQKRLRRFIMSSKLGNGKPL